jgi:hypothetical protein
MTDGFSLTLPGDARFRGLAAELAGRYARIAGGTEADAAAIGAAVTEALDRHGAGAERVDVACHGDETGIGVVLTVDGQAVKVRHPLHVRRA